MPALLTGSGGVAALDRGMVGLGSPVVVGVLA